MKKSLLYLFMLVCSVSLFSSCGDDDDEVKYPIDTDLAGGYIGKLSVVVDGNQMGTTENQKIAIAQSNKGANQIALSLKNFTFLINVGDIEVDPCTVKAIDGGYSFEGQQNLDLVAPLGNCPISILGTVKGSNINIEIGVKVGAPLNQDVKATFVGTKLTGNESSEAKITGFTFDSDIVTEQPVIDDEKGTITFKVSDAVDNDDLKEMIPTIEISPKAKITPATGIAQDFSSGKKVEYIVTAEDGTVKKYTAFVAGTSEYYSFENWISISDGAFEEPDGGWATSNTGVFFIKSVYPQVYNGDYPVVKSEDAKDGTIAAKLITLDTKGQAGAELFPGFSIPAIPKVTSGSLFLGTFETDIMNTLNSTKFGNPYYSKPITVQFSYKYTPGTVYYTCPDPVKAETVVEDKNKSDECSATAVIYEVPYWETQDPNDSNNTAYDKRLTGSNLYTNTDQVVAIATFTSGLQESYKDVVLTLNYQKDYDSTKKYRFAIIFSSSKDGDKFSGAPGSTLIVDNVKVLAEK
jgi:hypothetical protein